MYFFIDLFNIYKLINKITVQIIIIIYYYFYFIYIFNVFNVIFFFLSLADHMPE